MNIDIILITYNQEQYIAKAVESILMQETDKHVNIIVADDNSTDSTLEIIQGYNNTLSRFQFEFLPSNKCNVGISKNYGRAFAKCTGKYIFILEGDDYWCNPYHIEQHIEFLEAHHEASMSMNCFVLLNEDKSLFFYPSNKSLAFYNIKQQIVDINHLGNLSACCFRTSLICQLPTKIFNLDFADWLLGMFMAQYGLLAVLPDATSVYRINKKGQWSSLTETEKQEKLIDACSRYNEFFDGKYTEYFNELMQKLTKRKRKFRKRDWLPPILKYVLKLFIPENVRKNK